MSIRYNADEVLEMALEIERYGASFYERAAELGHGEEAEAMLLELAAMERDHGETFAEMRRGLSEAERKEQSYDPEGELPLYLRVMADKGVFGRQGEPAKALTGKEDIEDVLRFAIGLEKDSIMFYLGLHDLVPARLGGARVEQILSEEMRHIEMLGGMLRWARGANRAGTGNSSL
jgi:rubrerythrin